MKTEELIKQKAQILKSYVGLGMSKEECENFVKGIIESTKIVNSNNVIHDVIVSDSEDEAIKQFLIRMTKSFYSSGDDYYAHKSKSGNGWNFGYSNDYPMQHGNGFKSSLPVNFVKALFRHSR